MESELFEEILLGDFPSVKKAGDRKASFKPLKITRLFDEVIPADREGILKFRQEIYKAITTSSGTNREIPKAPGRDNDPILAAGQWYYKPAPISKGKSGMKEKLLSLLIECECMLLMGSLRPYFRNENRKEDAAYFGSLAIRKWSDYLQQAVAESLEITIAQKYLFAIICDLSERLREVEGKAADYMAPDWMQEIFSLSEEFRSSVYPTLTFTNLQLLLISKKQREGWKEQFADLLSEIMDVIHQYRGDPQVIRELTESLGAVERAVFLMEYRAPFLKDNAQKIANPEFMEEWMENLFKELRDEPAAKETERVLHALQRTDTMLQRVPGYDLMNDEWSGMYEIRGILRSYWSDRDKMDKSTKIPVESSVEPPDDSEKRNYSDTDEWAEQFANQYLSKDQVKRIFNIDDNDTFIAFLDRHGLSYHEVSKQNHLYDRDEVMALFEKIRRKR